MKVFLFNRIAPQDGKPEVFTREIRATVAEDIHKAREKAACDNTWDCVSMGETVASFRAVMKAELHDPVPDRRAIWSFEVDGVHVRWCGTLEQWEADCRGYVESSQGKWERLGSKHLTFADAAGKIHFKAVPA